MVDTKKSTAIGRVIACIIRDGRKTLKDVPQKLWETVNASYFLYFGEPCPLYDELTENGVNE